MTITARDLPTAPWRVIFLDVDGVLNSHPFLHGLEGTTWNDSDEHMLDPVAVALLQELVDRTGADVVLSSSWRYDHTPAEMQAMLTAAGCQVAVVGATPTALEDINVPCGQTRQRGHEIATWLEEHPGVDAFIILDDDADMAHLGHRLVQTTFAVGLTPEHVERAVRMLLEDV